MKNLQKIAYTVGLIAGIVYRNRHDIMDFIGITLVMLSPFIILAILPTTTELYK